MSQVAAGGTSDAGKDAFGRVWEDSIALAAGIFDRRGRSLYLNRGMSLLLECDPDARECRHAFVNPTFGALWDQTRDGEVFSGTLTLGDGLRMHRSLVASAWRHDDRLMVTGEIDVLELDRLTRVLIDANREISSLQRELIKQNRLLQSNLAQLDRQKRLHEGFAEIQGAILHGTDEGPLLDDLCEVAVRYGELALAWVGLPDGEGGIAVRAAAGRTAYLNDLRVALDDRSGEEQGLASLAYRTGLRQVVNDLDGAATPAPWLAHARRHGMAASAAFPLCTARGVIGVLSVYAERPDFFGADEIRLLDRLSTDLALAIEALHQAKALHESESRYRLIFDHAPLGLVHFDLNGGIIDCNPSYARIVGAQRADLLGRNLLQDLKEDRLIEAVSQSLVAGPTELDVLYRSAVAERPTPVRCFLSGIRDADGDIVSGIGIFEDFSERKAIEERLRASEERLTLAIEAGGVGIWDYAVGGDVLNWDAGMHRLHGRDPSAAVTDLGTWKALVHPEDRPRLERVLSRAPGGLDPISFDLRVPAPSGGEEREVRVHGRLLSGQDGAQARMIGICYDITEQKRADARIHALAFYDPLTRLANRRLLMERIEQAQARSQRRCDHGALMLLDIDHFKRLNDTRGHDMGDRLLVQIAARLKSGLRATDTAARLGGDEFVVLCDGLSPTPEVAAGEAAMIGEKIARMISEPYPLGGADQAFHCTASIGVTLFRGHDTPALELIKQADIAMYQAKRAGREALRLFQPEMQQAIQEMARRERALRQAVAQGDLCLFYQPQVDRNGDWFGCEALLRWVRRDGAVLTPAEFLHHAETTDLMLAIGDWVIETACSEMARLPPDDRLGSDLLLGLNVSPRQLVDPRFIERVLDIAERTRFAPCRLKLEVSEAALFGDVERVGPIITELEATGVGIELDDFGRGLSSLVHLRQLPLAAIKVDQGLISAIDSDPDSASVVRAAISVADALSLPVIAEGVEREAQHALLLDLGCTRFQGYLFGRPMPFDELREAFETRLRQGRAGGPSPPG